METQTLESILTEHPFFAGLAGDHMKVILGCASNFRFDAGELMIRQGEEANNFYLIRHGSVAVELHTPHSGPVTIQTLGEGEVLGWSWLIPPYQWRFDARALTVVRAIAMDGKCLREKCESNHDLGYEVLKRFAGIITQRLEMARIQLLDIYGVNP